MPADPSPPSGLADLPDIDLVKLFQGGDTSVFPLLVERHYRKAYQIAYGILQSPQDAEEVAQDTFSKIYKVLPAFRNESLFSTWLYSIATNFSRNKYRWNKCRGAQSSVSMDAPLFGDENAPLLQDRLPDGAKTPDDHSCLRELTAAIWEYMESITPAYREALLLRNVENRSYQDIAQLLGIRVGTVKSRLARGREELRNILERGGFL